MKKVNKKQYNETWNIILHFANKQESKQFRDLCKQNKAFEYKRGIFRDKIIDTKETKELLDKIHRRRKDEKSTT